jgi:putative flippase GtrA
MISRRYHPRLKPTLTHSSQPISRRLGVSGWGISLALGMLILLNQDWQLCAVVTAGAIAMLSAYSYQQSSLKFLSSWRNWRKKLQAFWHTPERPLVVAVAVGGLATVIMQMVITIWTETPNHWLALALTTQLLAILAVLALLLRQQFQQSAVSNPQQQRLEQIIEQLLSQEAGDRLIALRQLNKHLLQSSANSLPPSQQKALIDLCQTVMQDDKIPALQQAAQQTMKFLQQG